MSIIRQITYNLLAEEFSKYKNIDDPVFMLRGALDNPQLLEVLVLLDSTRHLENIVKEIDEVVHCNLDITTTLDIDITCFANRFFLRLVNLIPTNH